MKENGLTIEERFQEIENHINDLENGEPSSHQLLALQEEIIHFAAHMSADYIKKAENSSDLLSKLKNQATPHSLGEQILYLTKS